MERKSLRLMLRYCFRKIFSLWNQQLIIKNQSFWIINGKVEKHFWDKKNPRKVPWTVVFRKIHKKGLVEETRKRRTRKQQKVTRAIVGASIELINKKRSIKPEQRKSDREAAIRKAKEERKKVKEASKGSKPAAPKRDARQKTQKTSK